MIPIAAVLSALRVIELALVAFNGLPEPVRIRIVTGLLDDHDRRMRAWQAFTGWFAGLVGRIGPG